MPCTTCEANRRLRDPNTPPELLEEAKQVLAEAAQRSLKDRSLAELFQAAMDKPGDIGLHSLKLKELASQCEHVTDMGMRPMHSTIALLAGQPERMVSIFPTSQAFLEMLSRKENFLGRTQYRVLYGASPTVDLPEETDLLFLDTVHTANQIYLELLKYSPQVRRYIVRHDTQIYGETGEDGGPGLRVGIRKFLKEFPEWSVVYDTDEQYGLIVLSRDAGDKPELPSLIRQGFNFSRHLLKLATEGDDLVPEEVFQSRLDQCALCPYRVINRCSKCGCPLDHNELLNKPGKAAYAAEECPLEGDQKRWTKYTPAESV